MRCAHKQARDERLGQTVLLALVILLSQWHC